VPMFLRSLFVVLLLVPMVARADIRGVDLYARGDFEKALPVLQGEMENPDRSEKERARARIYLAASMYALGMLDGATRQLEELARLHPEQRVDPRRFPPDFVALADFARKTVETERLREKTRAEEAEQERLLAEAERRKREEETLQQGPRRRDGEGEEGEEPASSFRLRPEATAFGDFKGGTALGFAVGATLGSGSVEGTVRALIGSPNVGWEAEAGLVLGSAAFQPRLAVRGILLPGIEVPDAQGELQKASRFGFAGSVGARLALTSRVIALADVGYGWLFGMPAQYNNHVFVVSAGVGFNLF
jgi:hypothetical protein